MEPLEWIAGLGTAVHSVGDGLLSLGLGFLTLDSTISNTVGQMEGLAKALSPATAASFDYSMRNLTATLGQAAVPMFQNLIGVVDQLSGVVSPLAEKLGGFFADIVTGLTRPFLDLANAAVEAGQALTDGFAYLMPIVTAAADVIGLLLSAGLSALVEALKEWGKQITGAGSALDKMRESAQEAAKHVLLFAARLAQSLGQTGVVDAMIRYIERKDEDRGKIAAPLNVRTQDFAAIAQDMVQAAFAAGPGGAQQTEREYLRDILGDLRKIRETPFEFKKVIAEGFHELAVAIDGLVPKPWSPEGIEHDIGVFKRIVKRETGVDIDKHLDDFNLRP